MANPEPRTLIKMSTNIYILKLRAGKYYVGMSDKPMERYQQHLDGMGAAWTRKYKPVALETVITNASPFDEDKYTKEYMVKHGIENVRGQTTKLQSHFSGKSRIW